MILLLLATYILSRVSYLYFLNPYYFSVFPPEERYIGTIAKELMAGLTFPYWEYQANDYLGGSLVAGFLTVPFFKLFGASFLSLKLLPLVWFTLALFLWHRMIKRYFGANIAFYFALLFIFSPPSFTHYTLTNLGTHSETILFSAMAMTLLFELLERTDEKKPFLLLGIFSGFALWYSYIFAITIVSIWIFIALYQGNLFTFRSIYRFSLGLLLGFSPWLFYNLTHDFSGLRIYGTPVLAHFSWDNFMKGFMSLKHFPGLSFIGSFSYAHWGLPTLLNRAAALFYGYFYFIFIAYLVYTAYTKKSHFKESFLRHFFWVYPVVFLLIDIFSDFKSLRYFIPLHPFVFFWAAMGLSRLEESVERKKWVRRGFPLILLLAALCIHSPVLEARFHGAIAAEKGYAYQLLDLSICEDPDRCLGQYEELQKKLSPEDMEALTYELASYTVTKLPMKDLPREMAVWPSRLPVNFEPAFFYFLGREIFDREQNFQLALHHVKSLQNISDQKRLKVLAGVLDEFGEHPLPAPSQELSVIVMNWSPRLVPAFWRAIGQKKARADYEETESVESIVANMKREFPVMGMAFQKYYVQGIGKFFYHHWSQRPLEPYFVPETLLLFPEPLHRDLFYGVGLAWAEREYFWRIASKRWYWEKFALNFNLNQQEWILEGKKDGLDSIEGRI